MAAKRNEAGWQAALCQYFTRDEIARYCLAELRFPRDVLSVRLLEPAAGRGAFIVPLIPRIVRAGVRSPKGIATIADVVRAYEIDPVIAEELREICVRQLMACGVEASVAKAICRKWIVRGDFLAANIKDRFTHIVGNPPYIRWDSIPADLIKKYRTRFASFQARADLYVAFIEKALGLLTPGGQLGFLCPGNWTRNKYGTSIREELTSRGHIKSLVDFSTVDSFERAADAYPSFFCFVNGADGLTRIKSVRSAQGASLITAAPVARRFKPSGLPLAVGGHALSSFVERSSRRFPTLEDEGCEIRVGSATGCNDVFLGSRATLPVERGRLLPFVNARSIVDGKPLWDGTYIVNVFDEKGATVDLAAYPRLRAYLNRHRVALRARAKAQTSQQWWRTIDVLHPDWFAEQKILVADIASRPVIGLDRAGYCAGGGLYQIKSREWPLADLFALLSSGVLGAFVGVYSQNVNSTFNRFQKQHLRRIAVPRWSEIDRGWRVDFRSVRRANDHDQIIEMVAELYGCSPNVLRDFSARDWRSAVHASQEGGGDHGRQAMVGKSSPSGATSHRQGRARTRSARGASIQEAARSRAGVGHG